METKELVIVKDVSLQAQQDTVHLGDVHIPPILATKEGSEKRSW